MAVLLRKMRRSVELIDAVSTLRGYNMQVDGNSISRSYRYLFKHAHHESFVTPRVFPNNSGPALKIDWTLPGPEAVEMFFRFAQEAADHPDGAVFAPPICTFRSPNNAQESNIAQGLVLCVDCDKSPRRALNTLTKILGPPTLVVRSGGRWVDPETGEVEDKLHLYWVLRVPTNDAAGHEKLKRARQLATRLIDGDGSGVPLVHPMRCPGSWHTKGEPRLCGIEKLNEDVEIDLDAVLAALEDAAKDRGIEIRPTRQKVEIEKVRGQAATIARGCALVRDFRDNAESQSETLWFATHGILATCDDDSGKQAAHAWGSAYVGYTADETAAKFDRAKREDKPARCSTIEGMGFEGCKRCPFRGTITSPAELRHADPDFIELQARHVLNTDTGRYLDIATGHELREESFNSRYAHLTDGQVPHRKFTQSKLSPKVARSDYLPSRKELVIPDGPDLILNGYTPAGCEPREGDCNLIIDHVRWLLPEPVEHEHVFDALAHLVQRPGEKITSGILLIGSQGNGKSWLRNLIVEMLGEANCRKVENAELGNDWRRSWGNRQVLFIEEAVHSGKLEIANSLKEWLTGEYVMANEKNVPLILVRTPSLIFATSNNATPLHLDPSDRRWAVLHSPQPRRAADYYTKLFTTGLTQAPAFKAWLLKRDLSNFNAKAPPPMTDAKNELIEASRPPVTAVLHRLIKDGELNPVFTLDEAAKKLIEVGVYVSVHDKRLQSAVKELNCVPYPHQVRVGRGKKIRLWLQPEAAEFTYLESRKLSEIYLSMRTTERVDIVAQSDMGKSVSVPQCSSLN